MNSAAENPAQRDPRPASRLRRYAAAAGSLVLVGTLALSGLVSSGGVEQTEAAWTDTEHAQASLAAEWPEAFASVVAGSAKSANSMVNNSDDMTYESVFRWTTQMSEPANTPAAETTTPIPNYSRKWDERYRGPGVAIDDGSIPNNLGPVDPYGNSLHTWEAVREFRNPSSGSPRVRPRNFRCLAIDPSFDQGQYCNQPNGFAAASNTTDSFGFSMATSNLFITFLNAADLTTSVSCGIDSAYSAPPTGRVDVGTEQGGTTPYLSYGLFARHVRTIWAAGQDRDSNGFSLASGQISEPWNIGAALGIPADPYARVMPVITQYASPQGEQPYALSEIAAYVEIFNSNVIRPDQLRAKMYFVLSRSECGVKRIGDSALPQQRPVFPTELPGGNGLNPYTGGIWKPAANVAQPLVLQDILDDELAATNLPPMTTVTSPLENTTASETNTSAPPNRDEDGEGGEADGTDETSRSVTTTGTTTTTTTPTTTGTTTPTSAPPAIVIPSKPANLPATARTIEVGIVEADGEELDVVVQGDTVPADAKQGAWALENWLGGNTVGTTWKPFAAADPDEDGWRWAAINQRTGTVVYIR